MLNNFIYKRVIGGMVLLAALLVNLPIIILNLEHLHNWQIALIDVTVQVFCCFVLGISVVGVLMEKTPYIWVNRFKILVIFGLLIGYCFMLAGLNSLFLPVRMGMISSIIMRGAIVIAMMYLWSKNLIEAERKNALLLENQQLKHDNVLFQLNALKNQLNPHFLFNSLNTLSWLINQDTAKSQEYLQKLSQVLRYSLSMQEQQLVSLKDELILVENYVFLLQMRFGNNLQINISPIEPTPYQILPLSIQLLIENAIKHNVVSSSKPLQVDISFEEEHIVVSNKISPKLHAEGTGIGLANLDNRYKLMTGKSISIQKDTLFTVRLPLIKQS